MTDSRGSRQITAEQLETIRAQLKAERAETEQRIASLGADRKSIVESAEVANIDDEHDPEGSTIAYERALVISLMDSAHSTLGELDAAEEALDNGSYGRCSNCGEQIGVERLLARPTASTCVRCAAGPAGNPVLRR